MKRIAVALFLAFASALFAGELVDGVATYKGWPDCSIFTVPGTQNKVVVVPAIGGRILHYGPADANIIFENPGSDGKTLANTKGGFWVGGYQCDIGPETRGLPDHKNMWMGQYTSSKSSPQGVTMTSAPDAATGIQLEKEFKLDPNGTLKIVQRMKNISDKETNYCLWDRTLCKGGGFAFFPLNKKSRFPQGWAAREKGRLDKFNTETPSLPNVKILDGVLVVEAKGESGKLGADSDAGWIAYVRGRQIYVKVFPYDPKGVYSDAGNSVEVYWSPQVAEIEPLGPEHRLKPGESAEFPETWLLLDAGEEVKTFEGARALVEKVATVAAQVKK